MAIKVEDAIANLKNQMMRFEEGTEPDLALQIAIKALEQEHSDDAISRQAVLDTIGNVPDYDDGMVFEALSHAQRDVALLPPVTPQEPILDKIRTEIKAMFPPSGSWMYEEGHEIEHTVCEVLADVLKIIDNYKAESEDK